MDSVIASNVMNSNTNHAIEAMISMNEDENAVVDRLLLDNMDIHTKKNTAWIASTKCTDLTGLDKAALAERARVLYGTDDKSAPWMQ